MDWVLTLDLWSSDSSADQNPYGFPKNGYSLIRLSELLGIEKKSAAFQKISEDINSLRKKYLTTEYAAMEQMAGIQLIGTELMNGHPGLFKGMYGRKHLYFTLKVIVYFQQKEYRVLKLAKSSHSVIQNNEDSQASQNTARSIRSGNRSRAACGKYQKTSARSARPSVPYALRSKIGRGKRSQSVASDNSADREVIDLTTIPSSPARDVKPTIRVSRNNSARNSSPSTSNSEDQMAVKQEQIYAFLNTCQPPMIHYIQRFVDFGCVTDEHLLSVSQWRKEQRYNLVKDILQSSSGDDAKPTGMDIAILMNQFETYFMEN